MKKKSSLIICYTFPPATGIGGRRWAKFAKYLTTAYNTNAIVYAHEANLSVNSNWMEDTLPYKNNIYFFRTNYPAVLNKQHLSFIDKLNYRISLMRVKLNYQGNYYDKTCLLGEQFFLKLHELIVQNEIKNIIVTAGPFSWLTKIIALKKKYPLIKFIADFRDPWTNNKTAFGYTTISQTRFKYEQALEKKVVAEYDAVVSVSKEMNDYFKLLLQEKNDDKFLVIENGFDSEDYKKISPIVKPANKLIFLFAGTLYNKSEYLIRELAEALAALKSKSPELYSQLQFDFLGDMPEYFHQLLSQFEIVKYHGKLKQEEVSAYISASDVCMLFLTSDLNYSFSTKFYEYLYHKKTIAVFSKPGIATEFVEKNKLGYAIVLGAVESSLFKIIADWKNNQLIKNTNYDSSIHDVKSITQKVYDTLIF